jgi:hypothetical protein
VINSWIARIKTALNMCRCPKCGGIFSYALTRDDGENVFECWNCRVTYLEKHSGKLEIIREHNTVKSHEPLKSYKFQVAIKDSEGDESKSGGVSYVKLPDMFVPKSSNGNGSVDNTLILIRALAKNRDSWSKNLGLKHSVVVNLLNDNGTLDTALEFQGYIKRYKISDLDAGRNGIITESLEIEIKPKEGVSCAE